MGTDIGEWKFFLCKNIFVLSNHVSEINLQTLISHSQWSFTIRHFCYFYLYIQTYKNNCWFLKTTPGHISHLFNMGWGVSIRKLSVGPKSCRNAELSFNPMQITSIENLQYSLSKRLTSCWIKQLFSIVKVKDSMKKQLPGLPPHSSKWMTFLILNNTDCRGASES